MKNYVKRVILFWFCMVFYMLVQAQVRENRITGHVYDSQNLPLAGVNIKVKNTPYGTVSNEKGEFVLAGKWEQGVSIEFSFIGMRRKTITYKGQTKLEVTLADDTNNMDEVVVTAKANINEIDIRARSGVVQEVDMRRINSKPMIDMGLALQGSVPGLIVTNTGELGSAPEIRIRGNSSLRRGNTTNEPLYVMDGKVISSETFYNLNPQDIKEIKVLKDAAACALYGIKAANGVLEITSQRGISGQTMVTYTLDMGITTRGRRGISMMNSVEKLELERRLQNVETPGYRYSADYYNKYHADDPNLPQLIAAGQQKLDELKNINTDWFHELIRNSLYQKHNVSIRGGSEETTYYVSANYTQQGGRLPGNDKRRMSLRMNMDQKLGHIGYALLSVNGGYAKTNTPNGTTSDPTQLVYELNPYETKDSGELVSYPGRTYNDLMNQYSQEDAAKTAGISGSLILNPLPGLDVAAVAGLDFLLDETEQFTPSTAYSEMTTGVPEIQRGIY